MHSTYRYFADYRVNSPPDKRVYRRLAAENFVPDWSASSWAVHF